MLRGHVSKFGTESESVSGLMINHLLGNALAVAASLCVCRRFVSGAPSLHNLCMGLSPRIATTSPRIAFVSALAGLHVRRAQAWTISLVNLTPAV